MKTVLLYIVFVFMLMLNVYSGEMLINGNIRACPLFYEPNHNIVGIDFGTSWRIGYHINAYTIGLKTTFDYTLYDTMDAPETIQGTWLHTRVLFNQEYDITPGFAVKWAAGFIWFNNSIKNGTADTRITDFYGISLDFDLAFFLIKNFLVCEIINRVDLLYAFNSDFRLITMAPHYYGGLRFYVDFGIKWFQVYLEAKGQYWNYRDSLNKISTGIASGGVGFCFYLPPIKTNKSTSTAADPGLLNKDNNDSNVIEEKEKLDPVVEKLKTVTAGERVQFHNILFVKYSDEFLPVSYPVLDQITSVLKQRQGIAFTISAYAEYQENPATEFKLYTNRAKKIKEYLIQGGIEENRLKVSSIGQIVTQNNPRTGTTVIFKAVNEAALVE